MPMFKSINEGVNLLSGREREEYAGWKPRRRESVRDFDARIKALPIFTQLGLVGWRRRHQGWRYIDARSGFNNES